MKKRLITLSVLAMSLSFFASCKDEDKNEEPTNTVVPTDYTKSENWIYAEKTPTKEVDIFYVYPTVYAGPNQIMDITNQELRAKAKSMFDGQATAFETVGNLYAPYYRQSSLEIMEKSKEEKESLFHREPLTDVIAAFEFFIKNHNNGRPFILVAHSQGSNILMYFLSEYLSKQENKSIYDRMVAAYLIGYDITQEYLTKNPHLHFADTSYDTQVIISYNTEMPTIDGPNPVMADGKGIAINPLSWTRSNTKADSTLNLGTYIQTSTGYIKKTGFADAKINIERGTVNCSTVDPNDYYTSGGPFPKGVLHGCDFQFYYFNLRANAQERVNAYFGRK